MTTHFANAIQSSIILSGLSGKTRPNQDGSEMFYVTEVKFQIWNIFCCVECLHS